MFLYGPVHGLYIYEYSNRIHVCHARIQRGSNYDKVYFSFMRGGVQIPLLAGHQRPACDTLFKRRFAGGPMIAQHGILAW